MKNDDVLRFEKEVVIFNNYFLKKSVEASLNLSDLQYDVEVDEEFDEQMNFDYRGDEEMDDEVNFSDDEQLDDQNFHFHGNDDIELLMN